ncbi:SAM-dependent methyltransferase [Allocatelliglobosispora scoriae]|uniref:SAM-dependent methyltransferase n=1 Tax=Allocatelliglobosispora scoriae TaxID=643052 RepID=A0A841BY53_9ACTN|nr:class I SAM-dependent methyltransferase [Allocatelliglobosispora scoriae]MBB5871601.1 SAM-dependent methyltransferase [Allocatelliglobosispora scoriae]
MRTDYTEIFRDAANVEKYENVVYAPDSYASAVNRRQRDYLRGLARRAFPYRRPVQHDFACGTGRAIRILHGLVRGAHGYDTSQAMLDKAHEVGAYAQLHRIAEDGEGPLPVATESPAIVTVFRLLLNVDDSVRDRAIAFAAKALPHYDAGLLIVENHGNRSSLRHLRHRRHDTCPWFAELSHEQITELLDRHGFTVVERRGFSLFTQGWYGRGWLRPFASLIDDVVARTGLFNGSAVNVLYIARRTRPTLGTMPVGATDPMLDALPDAPLPDDAATPPRKPVDRDGESW